jgi:serine/threonine protein kinase
MPLAPGDQLGHYKIQSLIGKGGMGEVYKALDTKLDRDVAIKVLPAALSAEPDRLARFEREAKVLAQLNHPGLASIYGVEDRALVMELVPGPTLSERISQGPIPAAEAEEILLQIADALEYAHERGIIHRDLKPANIKIDPEDKVKILDFGLAKALSDPMTSTLGGDPSESPTVTMGGTIAGTILGTAAYMAPEQARGKKVDRRADIWAFGVVLWEMLTGERLFKGEDTVQVLSRVLEQPVNLDRIPPEFRKLLARCLDRNPKDRLRDIGEARFLLVEDSGAGFQPAAALPGGAGPSKRPWLWPAAAALLLLALSALSFLHFREQPPDPPKPVRFQLTPENVTVGATNRFALSPDGTKLAYFANGSDGASRLWIRAMDTLESRPLSATELNQNIPIFWSFDSRFVVFQSAQKLKKIDASGGPAQSLCDVSGTVVGGSWNRDGVILFGNGVSGPLMRVSSEGGAATPITALNAARAEAYHMGPLFLPDGRHFLYYRSGKPESSGIYVGSLDDQPGQPASKRLLATDYAVEFVPSPDGASGPPDAKSGPPDTRSGMILLLREGTLLAQPFDLRRLDLAGEAVPVAEQVANYLRVGQFSASRSGALVYRSGGAGAFGAKLTLFDRQGKTLGTPSDAGYDAGNFTLSPDGLRVAAARRAEGNTGFNIWLVDLARGGRTRFTFTQSGNDEYSAWSPDGTRLAFSSNRAGHWDLYQHAANGAGEDELLLKSDNDKYLTDWSRDGRFLVFSQPNGKGSDLWVLPITGSGPVSGDAAGERKPTPFLRSDFDTRHAHFSPDGRWIAYRSIESGRNEIYVRPFPAPPGGGGKWMVSQGGGGEPRWRRDGKEIFYLSRDGELMASQVSASSSAFQASVPKPLFKATPGVQWDVSPDGTRFLFPVTGGDTTQSPFTVVLNWMSLLKK